MSPKELPLFPLRTVLFPGMILPLHIFEMRYRIMIDACLQENQPFGVLLIQEGHEVGGPAVTYRIGTSAYITQAESLPDGRMNIVSVGYQRFALRTIREERPYKVGIIEDVPLPLGNVQSVKTLTKQLGQEIQQYLELMSASGGKVLEIDIVPEEGHALAYFAAIILMLRPEEKQQLLEADNVGAMLMMQRAIVRRELGFLRYGLGHDDTLDAQPLISVN